MVGLSFPKPVKFSFIFIKCYEKVNINSSRDLNLTPVIKETKDHFNNKSHISFQQDGASSLTSNTAVVTGISSS